jgi:putrescine transport system permease protein
MQGNRWHRYVSRLWLGGVFLFFYLPLMFLVVFSFNSTRQDSQFTGFSLRWYQALFDTTRSAHIHRAAGNSLWVAGMATLGASILAVLAALAIGRSRRPAAVGTCGQQRLRWSQLQQICGVLVLWM